MAKILFSTLTHGNEIIGLDVVKKIKKIERLGDKFDYIISNSLAFSNNSRYVDSDLNRIFPGNDQGNYEEQRAVEIINIGKKYDYVIDLHGSVSNTGVFIIITIMLFFSGKICFRNTEKYAFGLVEWFL